MGQKEHLPLVVDCVRHMLDNYNAGISKEQFYSKNILDVTDVTESDMGAVNQEVIEYCRENGCYAALPPFEEGVFIDRSERRYTHWKVLEICEDYYRIEFNHYPIIFVDDQTLDMIHNGESANITHSCWYRSCKTIIKVKLLTAEEHVKMLSRHPDFIGLEDKLLSDTSALQKLSAMLKTQYHLGGVLEDYEYYMPHDLKKIAKKGKYYTSDGVFVDSSWVRSVVVDTLELGADSGLNTILYCSTGPIIEMLVYVNYMLSQKSTSSSTLRNINSVYAPKSEIAEIRKERHFGKIKVVSEKKPRAVNALNIQRVYTTPVWQRRSHLRHLASGKVVPVQSATCKRHNVGDVLVPQVIYKV